MITVSGEASLADLVRLEDPEFYLHPHDVYDRMRREQPAYYYAPLDIFAFTDPPRHRELRKVLMPAFSPRAVHAMRGQIRESCRLLVDGLSPGKVTDVVQTVAARQPVLVATRLHVLRNGWRSAPMVFGADGAPS